MIKRCVLYARTSSDDGNETKLENQLELCADYASKRGYEIVDSLSETISGATTDRPELNKALFMAATNDFDVLICRDLDRLSRDTYGLGVIERLLSENGVLIEYVNETFDNSPMGNLMKNTRASFAEFEREMVVYRTRLGRYKAIKNGSIYTRMAPYGYDKETIYDDKTRKTILVINEQEARIVRMIYNWCLQGQSTYWIAKELNGMNIPTTYDKGLINSKNRRLKNEWSSPSVLHILHSKTIGLGVWSYRFEDTKEILTVPTPAIIDEQTYYAAQQQLLDNKRHSKPTKPKRYLIARLGQCLGCGYKMQSTTKHEKGKSYGYYRCTAKIENKMDASSECPKKYFPVKKIDAIIWNFVKDIMSNPEFLHARLLEKLNNQTVSPEHDRLRIIDDMIAEKNAELERYIDEIGTLTGRRSKTLMRQKVESLETNLDGLESERDRLAAKMDSEPQLDEKRIASIVDLASVLENELEHIEGFGTKRAIVELLNTTVYFGQSDNGYLIKVQCFVSEEIYSLDKENLSVVNKSGYLSIQQRQNPIVLEIGYVLDTKCNLIAA